MQRGIIRGTDSLHRVTIPKEFITLVGFKYSSNCDIREEGEGIIVSANGNSFRKIDDLGRVTVPAKFREKHNFEELQDMEIRCFDNCVYISLVGAELPASLE